MSGKIFISYRRDDTEDLTVHMARQLIAHFGEENVFFDIDIKYGKDFVQVLEEKLNETDILLGVIGKRWTEVSNPDTGAPRLFDPEDFVRKEIERALERGIELLPVLANGAPMPGGEQTPESLHPFLRRQAIGLSSRKFNGEIQAVIQAVEDLLAEAVENMAPEAAQARRAARAADEAERAAAQAAQRAALGANLSPVGVRKAEELGNWEFVKDRAEPADLRDHLARYGGGVSAPWARDKLAELEWARIKDSDDQAELAGFAVEFPQSRHAAAAAARAADLEARARRLAEAETAWRAVQGSEDPKVLAAFAKDYPHSPHAAEAERLARALRRGVSRRRLLQIGGGVVGLGALGAGGFAAYENRHTIRAWDTSRVYSVAIAPDGRRALSGGEDKVLKLWDLESGREIRRLEGHTRRVGSVAIAPDGRRALSGGWDDVLIWDLESGREIRRLEGHTSFVSSVAIAPDGRRALSGSWDNTLKLWDLESGREIRTLEGHTETVRSVAIAPDGRRALSGGWDKVLKLWDLDSAQVIRTLAGHTEAVRSVAIAPDGRRALSGGEDRVLRLWDLESGREIRTLEGHTTFVSSVAIAPDGRRALSGGGDGTLRLWDLESGREIRRLEHTEWVESVAIAPDGRRALSASWDYDESSELKLWEI